MKFFGTIALLLAVFAVGFASPSSADHMDKLFGVMDDNPVAAAAGQIGFNVVKRTIWIAPNNNAWDNPSNNPLVTPLPEQYRDAITTTLEEAQSEGVSVIIELYPIVKFGPPRRPSQMRGTCDVAKDIVDRWPDTVKAVEVNVEPNNYTFNNVQFGPNGTQASAAQDLKWTAACYDVIKKAHPGTLIIGGSLASSGEDDPHKPTSSTSPVLFLQKFCEAYKASRRDRPVMDWFDMHSYPVPEDQDPTVSHPYPSTTITIADYSKLSGLLDCFNGTPQPKPPICWCEGGYNTDVPSAMVGKNYSREAKPASVKLIDEHTQGLYAARSIQMAYCQPGVVGWINFHLVDDPDRKYNWQSGFAYAPPRGKRSKSSALTSYSFKQSAPAVRQALVAVKNGTMKCGPPGSP